MLALTLIMLALALSVSPMVVALCLIASSLAVSMTLYMKTSNTFTPAAIAISFSSGMMVMFFYCSMFTNYEKKAKYSMASVVAAACMTATWNSTEFTEANSLSNPLLVMSQPFLLMGVTVVMISMLCLNIILKDDKKSLTQSY